MIARRRSLPTVFDDPPAEHFSRSIPRAVARRRSARLEAQIAAAEAEMNARVYQLHTLTPDEIRLVEAG